jgi:hypothetical protein
MIVKTTKGGKPAYQVQGESGRVLGTYLDMAQAKKRLAQVEMFKSMKASGTLRNK